MKNIEKRKARDLREKGWSMNDIKDKLHVSKSSVSLWVRDIELSDKQKQELSRRGFKKEAIEKRRKVILERAEKRRRGVVDRAKSEIKSLSKKDLFLIGTMLYWGEGGKTGQVARVSNGDSNIIRVMMRFFREICEVPEHKFRGHLHIHPHLDYKKAEKYWSQLSGIPLSQLYKTYRKKNRSSKNKKDSLPFGTFDVYVCNLDLLLKIKGWIEGISDSLKIK